MTSGESCRHLRPSRADLVDRYRRNRARSHELFALLSDNAYYSQPIALRHPIVFYEGHLPGFSFNTLVRTALGGASIDASLERLFARGIDPHESALAQPPARGARAEWPSRETVRAFADEADRLVLDALQHADIEVPGHPLLDRGEAVFAILEHEEMHQETLRYMWHRLPFAQKTAPPGYHPRTEGALAPAEWIKIPAGRATLGVDRNAVPFGWDNESPAWSVDVPGFAIERHDVTNARFLEFVEAGGYRDARWWESGDWQWLQAEALVHPLFWERRRRRVVLARDVRIDPAAGVVAGVRQHGGSVGLRPMAWRATADRGRVPTRSLRVSRRRAPVSLGRRCPRHPVTVYSTSRAGTPSRRAAILTGPARGAWRISSGTDGSGRARRSRRSRDFARQRRTPSTPPTSSTASMLC